MKTKIAIACQGGGSQTAFTAGVLKALCEASLQDEFELVGISGTSGGALCAALVWYALHKRERPIWGRLMDFWRDNTAQTYIERTINDTIIHSIRMINHGLMPMLQISPASPLLHMMSQATSVGQRQEFCDFSNLLNRHIDFEEVATWGPKTKAPVLIIGAASVLSGDLRKFNSTKEVIRIEHLLASAAVPNLFPAVAVDGDALWDGLFSDNPPLEDLLRKTQIGAGNVPDELWIIKINPTTCENAPVRPEEIADRRNQLEGNISILQNLKWIELMNDLILADAFRPGFLTDFELNLPVRIPKGLPLGPDKPYHIPWIEMSNEMQRSLNYESKIDRSPENIEMLIAHGEERGRAFLAERELRVRASGDLSQT